MKYTVEVDVTITRKVYLEIESDSLSTVKEKTTKKLYSDFNGAFGEDNTTKLEFEVVKITS